MRTTFNNSILNSIAEIAQLAERLFCKQHVAGSNPAFGCSLEIPNAALAL